MPHFLACPRFSGEVPALGDNLIKARMETIHFVLWNGQGVPWNVFKRLEIVPWKADTNFTGDRYTRRRRDFNDSIDCDNGKISKSEATWKGWFVHVCHFFDMLRLVLICFDVRSNVFTLDGNWTLRVSTESLQGGLRYRWEWSEESEVRVRKKKWVASFCENRCVFATAGPRRFCMDLDGSERQRLAGDTGRWDFPHLFLQDKRLETSYDMTII